MKWLVLCLSVLSPAGALALPLIGSSQPFETTSLCRVYSCRLTQAERRQTDLANHFGVFSRQTYIVRLLPLLEMTINRDYEGRILAAAAYLPLNLEELAPYKPLVNGFYFEILGSQVDVASACRTGFPFVPLSAPVAENLSRVRGAPKSRTQTVDISCKYTFNTVVNPSVVLEVKIRALRMK